MTPEPEHPPDPPTTPLAWARAFLPHYFTDEPAAFHAELLEGLAAAGGRYLARVAPRGHAKSTCATLAYPLWCLCAERRRNIVIITHEGALARQFVRDIRSELEDNERLIATYGDLCAPGGDRGPRRPKWTEGKFTTRTGVTVQANSCGGSLRGARVGPQRPDLILCDDIEKDETVASPEGRTRLEHWLRRVVMPALAPDGQLVVLGSLLHHDSLLAALGDRRRFPGWDYGVYRALEYAPDPDDGTWRPVPLWPARWSVERLLAERERIGTLAFEQEYQANPIDEGQRVFRAAWLRAPAADLAGRALVTLMAVDPATGVVGGDFFAVWVGVVDVGDGVIHTRELRLERIGIVEQVKLLLELCAEWRPTKVGIETTAYQAALKDALADAGRRTGLYPPVVGLAARANKRWRIMGLAPLLESGAFRLPPVLPAEVEKQFLEFPRSRHDDAPDVCALAVELARETLGGAGGFDGLLGGANGRESW